MTPDERRTIRRHVTELDGELRSAHTLARLARLFGHRGHRGDPFWIDGPDIEYMNDRLRSAVERTLGREAGGASRPGT